MSNANRDYAIVYDVKNSSLVLSRPLVFYITDQNTSNIFVRLVTKVNIGNGVDQYTDIEEASSYALTMRVIKPNNEVKSIEATQHELESIFQFDLTEDFKDISGKYICELIISTIVSERQELITSDPFNYEVKRSILSNVSEIIETEDITTEKLLNNIEASKIRLFNDLELAKTNLHNDLNAAKSELNSQVQANDNKIENIKEELNSRLDATKAELSSQIKDIENVVNLLIEDYSEYAEGNDYSNVITYIMNNVVDETKRTVINFKPGKDYIINAKINKRNITLTGSANIIGKLEVGLDNLNQNDTNNPWYDTMMHCIIDGLSFIPTMYFPDWEKYDNHGIWLFNARSVTIRNCYFANMKYPIYFKRNKGEWIAQHTHRVRILNCTFMCVGYNLYGEEYNIERVSDRYLEYGDIDFQGNFCEETKIANIKMAAMDGFTCFSNTFFLEKAEGNIEIYYTPAIHISNNKIFEPGTHAINIHKTQDLVITGNYIFNSGLKGNEPAIRIEMGLWFETDYGICGVISENIFRKCQGSAIEIVNDHDNYGCTNYIITSNYMHIEGSDATPIKASGYSQGVVVSNNISNKLIDMKKATYAIANNNALTDAPGSYSNSNIWKQWNGNAGNVTMNLQFLGANQHLIDSIGDPTNITIAEPSDKSSLSDFKILIVESLYGQTTLKNTSFIQTKTKGDINLNANETAIFIYVSGSYRQFF